MQSRYIQIVTLATTSLTHIIEAYKANGIISQIDESFCTFFNTIFEVI